MSSTEKSDQIFREIILNPMSKSNLTVQFNPILFPQKMKSWFLKPTDQDTDESLLIQSEKPPKPVFDSSSFVIFEESLTAVSGQLLQADNIADIHRHLFDIFFKPMLGEWSLPTTLFW